MKTTPVIISLLLLLTTSLSVYSAPRHQMHNAPRQNYISREDQDLDEPRQVAELVSGLVGTAVGTVTSPVLGAFAPLLGGLIGSVVGQAISNATSMALGILQSE